MRKSFLDIKRVLTYILQSATHKTNIPTAQSCVKKDFPKISTFCGFSSLNKQRSKNMLVKTVDKFEKLQKDKENGSDITKLVSLSELAKAIHSINVDFPEYEDVQRSLNEKTKQTLDNFGFSSLE